METGTEQNRTSLANTSQKQNWPPSFSAASAAWIAGLLRETDRRASVLVAEASIDAKPYCSGSGA
jgi:hypothetical protein